MVKFENVTKKFGSTKALEDVSFDIEEGDFIFLTGHSGAGKTTLLKLLLRELKPDSGKIIIDGVDIATLKKREVPFYRRKLGIVFQDFKLLYDRTVYENVELALEVAGDKEKRVEKIKKALEEVGLSDKANLFPRQLSGGELQRAVIARAIVSNPKLIIADEPTGNLDPVTSRQIVDLLNKATDSNTTVIMATHNENIVNSLKRRVINLKEGKLSSDKKAARYEE
ncbi:MAG: cell division ATP-binding protein FtsE [bacterium]|nr:cell division ATP-binding protein FtsE [bacterium]